jgi:phospholipase/carboxylesterase
VHRLGPLVLLPLILLSTSFSAARSPDELDRDADPRFRVERHFAAGLEYLLVEPASLPPEAELPMVVYLHGRGAIPEAPEDDFLQGSRPVRVILPRGPEAYGEGFAWMPVSAHHGESPALNRAVVARGDRLAEALSAWEARHPTRGAPLVVGFSQGGILAMYLAFAHPDRLSRVVAMASWLPESLRPRGFDPYAVHPPVATLHGAEDPVLPPARTRALVRDLADAGYPATFEQFEGTGHEMSDAMADRLQELLEAALRDMPESPEGAGTT